MCRHGKPDLIIQSIIVQCTADYIFLSQNDLSGSQPIALCSALASHTIATPCPSTHRVWSMSTAMIASSVTLAGEKSTQWTGVCRSCSKWSGDHSHPQINHAMSIGINRRRWNTIWHFDPPANANVYAYIVLSKYHAQLYTLWLLMHIHSAFLGKRLRNAFEVLKRIITFILQIHVEKIHIKYTAKQSLDRNGVRTTFTLKKHRI